MSTLAGLKQTDWQMFLQQRWVYSGSAENGNLWSATMVSHMLVPVQQGKEDIFNREEKGIGTARVNKGSMGHLPGNRRSLSSSCWVLLSSQGIGAPSSSLLTLLNWDFCLLIFYILLSICKYQGPPLSARNQVTLHFQELHYTRIKHCSQV